MAEQKRKIDGEGDAPGGGLHPVVIVLGAYVITIGPLAILQALDIPSLALFVAGLVIFGLLVLGFACGILSWCFPPAEPQPPPPSRKGRKKRRAT